MAEKSIFDIRNDTALRMKRIEDSDEMQAKERLDECYLNTEDGLKPTHSFLYFH